jgi:flagellar biosynthesis component FlhA
LLVVVVATAYLVGTRVAKHHVVAQGVYVVNELRAYELLAFVGTAMFLARVPSLPKTISAAISASISSSAVLLTVFPPSSCGHISSIPQPPLYNIGDWPCLHLSP